MMNRIFTAKYFLLLGILFFQLHLLKAQDKPNILLVIADDLGVDVLKGYHEGNILPNTPTLDSLRSVGLTFENVFSYPVCTPSRASIMSGKFGVKTGVTGLPGNLDLEHSSIFSALASQSNGEYSGAVIGKWHISNPTNPLHPSEHGIDYYMGVLMGAVQDYYAWPRTENGTTTTDSSYITSSLTDAAIDWVNTQTEPWLLWYAHVAPHTPLHVPPSHMYSINATGTNYRKYIAMIESVDYELNRLLYSIPEEVRENTLIIFIGDNGTPNAQLQDYPNMHGKGTLYQGGVRVPMIVAGAGVNRQGEREAALVHINDIYATILELAGQDLDGGIYNSLSFKHLLEGEAGPTKDYNYTESNNDWTIRGPQYKLMEWEDGTQEMYDLLADSLEFDNLLDGTLTAAQIEVKNDLEAEALQIRTAWSCRDHIRNGDEIDVDCGGTYCPSCTTSLEETEDDSKIQVFPNPATNFITIRSEKNVISAYRIFNLLGELLMDKNVLNARQVEIDIASLNAQMLLLELQVGGQTKKLKLVKQ